MIQHLRFGNREFDQNGLMQYTYPASHQDSSIPHLMLLISGTWRTLELACHSLESIHQETEWTAFNPMSSIFVLRFDSLDISDDGKNALVTTRV